MAELLRYLDTFSEKFISFPLIKKAGPEVMNIDWSLLDWAIEFSDSLVDSQHLLKIKFTLDYFAIFNFVLLSLERNDLFYVSLVN